MRIRVEFGYPAAKIRECSWSDDLGKFPRVITLNGDSWEFVRSEKSLTPAADYTIIFKKVDSLKYVGLELPDFDGMFSYQISYASNCECGSKYDRNFPNIHSRWCPKYGRD